MTDEISYLNPPIQFNYISKSRAFENKLGVAITCVAQNIGKKENKPLKTQFLESLDWRGIESAADLGMQTETGTGVA